MAEPQSALSPGSSLASWVLLAMQFVFFLLNIISNYSIFLSLNNELKSPLSFSKASALLTTSSALTQTPSQPRLLALHMLHLDD